ncbi:MAG: hypothetical protein ACPGOY_18995 [Rhodospirillaceae bacterium]
MTGGGHVRLQLYAYDIRSRKTYWVSHYSQLCYNQDTGDFLMQTGYHGPDQPYVGQAWQLSIIANPTLHQPSRPSGPDEVFVNCRYQKKPTAIPKDIPGIGIGWNFPLPNQDGRFVRNPDLNVAAAFDFTGRELFRITKPFPIRPLTQANYDGSYTIQDARMAPMSNLFPDPVTGKMRPAPEYWRASNCLWFMRFRVDGSRSEGCYPFVPDGIGAVTMKTGTLFEAHDLERRPNLEVAGIYWLPENADTPVRVLIGETTRVRYEFPVSRSGCRTAFPFRQPQSSLPGKSRKSGLAPARFIILDVCGGL